MSGAINGQEFSRATLNTSVRQEAGSGATTILSSISHIPASVGKWVGGGQSLACTCALRPAQGLTAGGNLTIPKTESEPKRI